MAGRRYVPGAALSTVGKLQARWERTTGYPDIDPFTLRGSLAEPAQGKTVKDLKGDQKDC